MASNTSHYNMVKPAYDEAADVAVINSNMDIIDGQMYKNEQGVTSLQDGMAIVANGNTHAAISAGQFVYVKNHDTLNDGLYTANSNIAANATLSTSNLTADSSGGLNALNSNINSLIKRKTVSGATDEYGQINLGLDSRTTAVICVGCYSNMYYHPVLEMVDNHSSAHYWQVRLFDSGNTVKINTSTTLYVYYVETFTSV